MTWRPQPLPDLGPKDTGTGCPCGCVVIVFAVIMIILNALMGG